MSLLETLRRLGDGYGVKHFRDDVFDLEAGYLQTSVENNDDRMPLQFFVDYNNIWWFPLLRSIDVYHVAIDAQTGTGGIAFAIQYEGEAGPVHAMQYVRFNEAGKIDYIRTFANPNFWVGSPNPVVQLDAKGNQIWLGTGYSMDRSVNAAITFLDESPEAEAFRATDGLRPAIDRIRKNLDYYVMHQSTQWK